MSHPGASTIHQRRAARATIKEAVKEYKQCANLRKFFWPLGQVSFVEDQDPEPLGWTLLHLHNTHSTDGHKGLNYPIDNIYRPRMPMTKARKIAIGHPSNTEAENLAWATKRLRNEHFAVAFIYIPIEPQLCAVMKQKVKQEERMEPTGNHSLDVKMNHSDRLRLCIDLHTIRMSALGIPRDILPNRTELVPVRKDVAFGLEINGQFIFAEKVSSVMKVRARRIYEWDMSPEARAGESSDLEVTMIHDGKIKTTTMSFVRAFLLCRMARTIIEGSCPEKVGEWQKMERKSFSRRYGNEGFTTPKEREIIARKAKMYDEVALKEEKRILDGGEGGDGSEWDRESENYPFARVKKHVWTELLMGEERKPKIVYERSGKNEIVRLAK